MNFFISGELDSEVAEFFRPIRKEIEQRLNDEMREKSYGQQLEKIGLTPIILGPSFEARKERKLIQHKERAADYRLIIDFESFLNASPEIRKSLLIENLLSAIEDINRKLGKEFHGEQLIQDIISIFPTPECNR